MSRRHRGLRFGCKPSHRQHTDSTQTAHRQQCHFHSLPVPRLYAEAPSRRVPCVRTFTAAFDVFAATAAAAAAATASATACSEVQCCCDSLSQSFSPDSCHAASASAGQKLGCCLLTYSATHQRVSVDIRVLWGALLWYGGSIGASTCFFKRWKGGPPHARWHARRVEEWLVHAVTLHARPGTPRRASRPHAIAGWQ
jgi:hypothetical protein